jgi:hypothetical protein
LHGDDIFPGSIDLVSNAPRFLIQWTEMSHDAFLSANFSKNSGL